MSSTGLDCLRRTLAFRLTAWYATVFGVGTLLLFGLCYHLLGVGLKAQEREGVETKLVELAGEYREGGLDAVVRDAALSTEMIEGPPFLVRLADGDNRTRFRSPRALWGGFDSDHLGERFPTPGTWLELRGRERILQVASVQLPDGSLLQVGRSAVRLDRALERFREIFGSVLVPLLFGSIGVGWFLARRALDPVRSLTRALQATEQGDLTRRVPSPGSGDELEDLVRQYNQKD
jgi:HAMP domain-containing protein